MTKHLFLLALVILNISAAAQNFDENHSGSWLEFHGNNKIHEKWSIPLAGILRHHYLFEMHDFSFVRTGVSYQISPASTITGGIAYVNSHTYDESSESSTIHQYWIYEEFMFKHHYGRNDFSHRWRLENRWIDKSNKTYFKNRLRYRLQYSRKIYGRTFLKTSNETFFNLSDASFFDQNRFYIGVGRNLTPSFKVDIGYLKNHFKSQHYGTIRMGIAYTIDFTQKEVASIAN